MDETAMRVASCMHPSWRTPPFAVGRGLRGWSRPTKGDDVRRVRALAAAAVGAALLAGCLRPVDVAPSTTAEPAVTSTVAPSGTASASSRTSPHRTDLPRTLRVAVSFDQPGIGLRQGNSYTGLDVDVAEHIARYLGIPRISFVEAVTDQRRTLLETGQVDLVLAAYSMTPERADDVTFAGPYLTTGQDLLVPARSRIRSVGQLQGSTLCSVQGSRSTDELVDDHPGLHLTVEPKISDCVALLSEGTVDAVTSDAAVLLPFVRGSGADRLRLVGRPFTRERWGVAMRREDTALCEDVSSALADMVETGEWQRAVTDNLGPARSLPRGTATPPPLVDCPAPRGPSTRTTGPAPASS